MRDDIPAHWGQKGSGGYLAYRMKIRKEQKELLGEKYSVEDCDALIKEQWPDLDPQEKWEQYGVGPP